MEETGGNQGSGIEEEKSSTPRGEEKSSYHSEEMWGMEI